MSLPSWLWVSHRYRAMLLMIDNYDSFTYNLVQYFGDLGHPMRVYRNDKITVDDILEMKPKGIVISPGPGNPDSAGICLELVGAAEENDIALLGICLGHQTLGQYFGGNVMRAPAPVHGKTATIKHEGESLFAGLPPTFEAARYHSLIVARDTLPDCLRVTAETDDGLIMGLSHKDKPLHGIQFHPESIATEYGHDMLKNFTDMLGNGS